jgi:hypothetical protein
VTAAVALKRCTRCKTEKPCDRFVKDRGRRDGLFTWCKDCTKARNEQTHIRKAKKRWREDNQDHLRRYFRTRRIEQKYGLTIEEYEAIIARGCAICGTHDGLICLDHDHTNGRIRDALCQNCNSGLGMFKDDLQRLRTAIDYLEAHQ